MVGARLGHLRGQLATGHGPVASGTEEDEGGGDCWSDTVGMDAALGDMIA